MKSIPIILLLLILVIPVSANPTEMGILGKWGFGATFDVVANGSYVYVGAGDQINAYNISSATQIANLNWNQTNVYPFETSLGTYKEGYPAEKVIQIGSAVHNLMIDGSYLYVAAYSSFSIVNISNPGTAYVQSNVSGLDYEGFSLNTTTNKIYVARGAISGSDGGVDILDIADKSNIHTDASYELSYYKRGRDVAQYGDYLYVSKLVDNGVDIINHTNGSIVGGINLSYNNFSYGWSQMGSVKVKGNYLYLIEYHQGLHIYDISNPTSPNEVSSISGYDTEYNYNDIELYGDYAYVSERYKGINIIDISNPLTVNISSIISRVDTAAGYSEGISQVSLSFGDYTFLSTNSQGMQVINSTNKSNPFKVSTINVPSEGDSIICKDDYCYYGGHNVGIWVVNVSNASNPQYVAEIITNGRTQGLTIQNNTLFANGYWGARAVTSIDITDPENPVILQAGHPELDMPYDENNNYPWDLTASGDIVAVGNYLYNGYMWWDYYTASDSTQCAALGGSWHADSGGYCVDGRTKLVVYNITNKSEIRVLNRTYFGFGASARITASYQDNYLLGSEPGSVYIINITNKTAPKLEWQENSTVLPFTYASWLVVNDTAFLAGYSNNFIKSYNISNPASPILLDTETALVPAELTYYNNTLYVGTTDASYGFRAYNVTDPSAMSQIDVMRIGGARYTGALTQNNGTVYFGSGWIVSPVGDERLGYRIEYTGGGGTIAEPPSDVDIVDSELYAALPNSNYGSLSSVSIKDWFTTDMRAVWSIPTTLYPNNSVFSSVILNLTLSGCGSCDGVNLTNHTYQLYRLNGTKIINESGVTWNIYDTGLNWTNPGGDYYPGFVNFTVPNVTNTHFEINITEFMQQANDNDTTLQLIAIDPVENFGVQINIWAKEIYNSSLTPTLSVVYSINDTTPPESIENLHNESKGNNYILWSWEDSIATDFNGVLVYLDGVYMETVLPGIQQYNATGLTSNTNYTLSTHTVDLTGNINPEWINSTILTNESLNATTDEFDIYIDNVSIGAHIPVSTPYYNYTGLTANTTYLLSVRTYNTTYGTYSIWVNTTVTTDEEVPASTNTTPLISNIVENVDARWTNITFDVNQSDAITRVCYGLTTAIGTCTVNQTTGSNRFGNLSVLVNNTFYYYSIFAWNGTNQSYNYNTTMGDFTTDEDYVQPHAPAITSYTPTNLTQYIFINNLTTFEVGANQSVNWTWTGVTEGAGDGTTNGTATQTWITIGAKTVTATCSNANGSCGTIQWNVTVLSLDLISSVYPANNAHFTVNSAVNFSLNSTVPINYSWKIDNIEVSTSSYYIKTYTSIGSKLVHVDIDWNGINSSYDWQILITRQMATSANTTQNLDRSWFQALIDAIQGT